MRLCTKVVDLVRLHLVDELGEVVRVAQIAVVQLELSTVDVRILVDVIEAFGVDRCMFESNFPVDKLSSNYGAIWQAFDQITADFKQGERQALFHDNAARFYRL